jgi:hypothetical protein
MIETMYTPPANTEEIYARTEKEVGVQRKEAQVNNLQSQITAITNRAEAQKLGLVGQGRGITETIIGGQQAQIDREAAIKSLPIAAQLAAAQDDLESARTHLQTLFQIRTTDARERVAHQNKIIDTVFSYATDMQKEQLADRRTKEAQQFQVSLSRMESQERYSILALENYMPALAGQIAALDPNSPTYQAEFASLQKKINIPRPVVKAAGPSATQLAASKNSDVAQSYYLLKDQRDKNGWAGANPDAYASYKSQIINQHGYAAALEFDKLLTDNGVTVDYANK